MLLKQDVLRETLRMEREDPLSSTAKRFTWEYRRKRFRERIIRQAGDLSDFLTWPTATEAIFSGETIHTPPEFTSLGSDRHRLAAIDPPVGNPNGSPAIDLMNGMHSGTYVRQAAVCRLIERYTGIKPYNWGSLYEFGGGYGALAVVTSRLGFPAPHTICDFPELALLQDWYLGQLEIYGTVWATDPKDPTGGTHSHNHLFVSVCALDEAPERTRRYVLDNVTADHYLIWYTKAMLGNQFPGDIEWFERYFMRKYGKRAIDISIQGMNPAQSILYVDGR